MSPDNRESPTTPKPWRNPKVLAPVVSGVLLLTGWLLSMTDTPDLIARAVYIASLITGGYFFIREAVEDLFAEAKIGIDLLMGLAAVVAALMGQTAEGAMLAFLYAISEAAEGYTEDKTRAAVRALMELAPKTALVRREGEAREVPVEALRVGDLFIVRPGESIPTDGEVEAGRSSVDQAPVTGESVPVEKAPGDPVFAGTINGEGTMDVRATRTFEENTISRIVRMVEEAQERKGRSQRFIERFGARYSPAVLALGVLIAVVPPLLWGAPWSTWITRATVVLVAAAPCALVISIPVTMVATLGTAARKGVLIKGGIYVEHLARVRVVAVDKTGTLTRGTPDVTDVTLHPGSGLDEGDLLALAAGVERRSEHPLAQAVLRAAESRGIAVPRVRGFESLRGAGAAGTVGGRSVLVGSPDLFAAHLDAHPETQREIERYQHAGKTVVLVGDRAEEEPSEAPAPASILGLIAIRDTLRANARRAIDDLHAAGVEEIVMLTGDNERTAQAIASELGLDRVYAGLKPEDKVRQVRELAQDYGHTVMVGDGVNDAPAMAEADVGVAMGAAGTDVALETADVALMGDDLETLGYAIRLAKRSRTIVNQNLALSALVIAGFAIGGVGGIFTLPAAVVGHELSEFVVIGNGLRMLRG